MKFWTYKFCSGPVELSHQQFPTSLYMYPGSVKRFGEALVGLMDHFKWKTLSIINDRVSKVPLGARTVAHCRGCLTVLQQAASRINYLVINIDSSIYKDDLEKALIQAKDHSRSKLLESKVPIAPMRVYLKDLEYYIERSLCPVCALTDTAAYQ